MEYESSGEGYWHVKGDPSKGVYGIPPEVDKEIEENWKIRSILDENQNKLRMIKALRLIRESQGRDIGFKINFLRRLFYSHIYARRGKISFGDIKEEDYPNVSRFYHKVIEGLNGILNHPEHESKLTNRLDSFQ